MNAPTNKTDDSPVARVLTAIAGATSKTPADCRTLAPTLGLPEIEVSRAVEVLRHERLINMCSIQRAGDEAPWAAIWPTGLPLAKTAWSGNGHSALFASGPVPLRLPARPDPARDPRPDLGHASPAQHAAWLREQVANEVAGRTRERAVSVTELARKLGVKQVLVVQAVNALVESGWAAKQTVDDGFACRLMVWSPATELTTAAANFSHLASEIAEQLGKFEPEPEPGEPPGLPADEFWAARTAANAAATASAGLDIHLDDVAGGIAPRFALWDDGALSIHDEDTLIQLDRSAVRRLALLLGVPRDEVVHGGAA